MKMLDDEMVQTREENDELEDHLFSPDNHLRRSFTVRASPEEEVEPSLAGVASDAHLLSIDKIDLFRMKTEFRENFVSFVKGGMAELDKTITMKMYAIDQCDKQFAIWTAAHTIGTPEYSFKELTNR